MRSDYAIVRVEKYGLFINDNKKKGLLTAFSNLFQSKWRKEFIETFAPNIELEKCKICGLKEFMH